MDAAVHIIEAVLQVAGLVAVLVICAGAIAAGCVFVFREMDWSPINITVNVYLIDKEQVVAEVARRS